jgi:hypothetical protein
MAGHYLFKPEFCYPASGWQKGQVEKKVQDACRRLWQRAGLKCLSPARPAAFYADRSMDAFARLVAPIFLVHQTDLLKLEDIVLEGRLADQEDKTRNFR